MLETVDINRDEQALYEELSILHYIVTDTYKLLNENVKFKVIPIALSDGSKMLQKDIYKRLKTVVVPYTLRHLPFIQTDEKQAYSYALTYTDIQKTVREYWRNKDSRFFQLPIDQMNKVIAALDSLPSCELYVRLKAELERLGGGLRAIINRGY